MESEIKQQLDAQAEKIDAIYESVEKTRKYFLIIMWSTVAMIVIPGILLAFAIPAFIDSYVGLSGLI